VNEGGLSKELIRTLHELCQSRDHFNKSFLRRFPKFYNKYAFECMFKYKYYCERRWINRLSAMKDQDSRMLHEEIDSLIQDMDNKSKIYELPMHEQLRIQRLSEYPEHFLSEYDNRLV
jgi:hypothetical protein